MIRGIIRSNFKLYIPERIIFNNETKIYDICNINFLYDVNYIKNMDIKFYCHNTYLKINKNYNKDLILYNVPIKNGLYNQFIENLKAEGFKEIFIIKFNENISEKNIYKWKKTNDGNNYHNIIQKIIKM